MTVAREAAQNHIGFDLAQHIVADAEFAHDARGKVFRHKVGMRNQLFEEVHAFGAGQIEGDRLLVEIDGVEIRVAVPRMLRRFPPIESSGHRTVRSATPGIEPGVGFELNDFSPHKGEKLGGKRAGPGLSEDDASVTGQWAVLTGCTRSPLDLGRWGRFQYVYCLVFAQRRQAPAQAPGRCRKPRWRAGVGNVVWVGVSRLGEKAARLQLRVVAKFSHGQDRTSDHPQFGEPIKQVLPRPMLHRLLHAIDKLIFVEQAVPGFLQSLVVGESRQVEEFHGQAPEVWPRQGQ